MRKFSKMAETGLALDYVLVTKPSVCPYLWASSDKSTVDQAFLLHLYREVLEDNSAKPVSLCAY